MNGAFKGLDQADVYLTSYISKKQWEVLDSGSNLENLGISKIIANSGSLPYYVVGSDVLDGYNQRLAYEGFKVSYYTGSIPESGSFTGSYDLNLQSTLTLEGGRDLPNQIFAYSIPRDCFGETIEEGSIHIITGSLDLIDKEGLILKATGSQYEVVGDVIYNQGLILLHKDKVSPGTRTRLKWTSRKTINTWNVICKVKDLECNYTYNPRAEIGYTPYITTVGLYNRTGELMATAKMSKPIKKASNIDTTFKINIDIS